MKYILPRIQVFVSFAIKKGTKECIRVRTIHTSVLNFKAYLQIQTLILTNSRVSHKNTLS